MKGKRLFALLMSVMMIITYMPAIAFAGTEEATGTDVPEVTDVQPAEDEAAAEEAAEPEPAEADGQTDEAAAETTETIPDEPAEAEPAAEPEEPATEPVEPEQAGEPELISSGQMKIKPGVDTAGNDELFEQYFGSEVDKAIGRAASSKKRAARTSRYSKLNSTEQYIYDQILVMMQDLASGNATRAELDINLSSQLVEYLVETGYSNVPWAITYESLGLSTAMGVYVYYEYEDENGDTQSGWQLSDEAKEKLFDIEKVVNALLMDQPYYSYWFDKTAGYGQVFGSIDTSDGVGSDAFFEGAPILSLSFTVAEDYRAADGDEYDVDAVATASTATAVETAENIIEDNSGLNDVSKLYAYKDAICGMTSYNMDAAAGNYEHAYGDPWQLIWVFDNDESTNVVCEGYSKAFQFLCDKSSFENSDIECHTVSGTMSGGTGAGEHMWNILHMDDNRNYLADITNCDEGTVGYPDALFLKGYTGGSFEYGYVYSTDTTYEYDSDTFAAYDDAELTMSANNYGEGGGSEISSISFEPAEPVSLMENTNGELRADEIWNEETGQFDQLGEAYYHYYWSPYSEGNKLVVDDVEYMCGYFDDVETYEFRNSNGEALEGYLNYYDNQSYENQWTVENPGKVTVEYMGQTCEVIVEITENPVKSISFEPATLSFIENNGGSIWPEQIWNDETGEYDTIGEYYHYDWSLEGEGNKLFVNDVEYTCSVNEETWTWEFRNSDGEKLEGYLGSHDDQSYENPWTIENPGTITVEYMGQSCEIPVTITENPIKSISFEPAEPISLIEGLDGELRTDEIWNEEEGVWETTGEYFRYSWQLDREGSKLIVNGDVTYTYGYGNDGEGEWGLYNSDGEKLEGYVNWHDDQSYENPWTIDNPGTITVEYMGQSCEVPVEIKENPVKSISFEPASLSFAENANGELKPDEIWNEEEGVWETTGEYYHYSWSPYNEGSKLIINGEVTYTYGHNEDYYWGFYNSNGEALEGTLYCDNDQSYDNQWTIDNPGKFTLTYMGQSCEIPVTIIENPIKSISFKPAEPISFIEGQNGQLVPEQIWNEEEGTWETIGEYYRYEWTLNQEGNRFIVNNEVTYTYGYNEEGDGGFFTSEGEKLEGDLYWHDDQSYENPWTIDDPGMITVEYMGRSCEVPVEIKENPVRSISFVPAEPISLIENISGSIWPEQVWNEEKETWETIGEYFHYDWQLGSEGSKLIVNNDVTYTYGYGSDGEGEWGLYTSDGERLEGYLSWHDDQSYENPWTIDNPGTITVEYMGQSCEVPVEIKENPVRSISFVPAEPISFIENTNGEIREDERWNEEEGNFETLGEYFHYDWNLRQEGNRLIVNGEVTYTYGYDEEGDGGFYTSEGEKLEGYLNWHDDQAYDNQWTVDNPGTITVEYMNQSCEVPVEITENPVKSFSFEPAEPISITEETNGRFAKKKIRNPETNQYEYVEYYVYYIDPYEFLYKSGSKLIVNDVVYTYGYKEEYGSAFYNSDGEKLDTTYLDYDDDQSYDNQWTVDNPGTITVSYMGKSSEVSVTITENPVKTISYTTNREFIEGRDCSIRKSNGQEYFLYSLYPEKGDVLTVNNEKEYVYQYHEYGEDEGEYGFYHGDEALAEDAIGFSSNQKKEHWAVPEGETETTVTFTVTYMGRSCEAEAKLIKNPVTGITFTPANEYVNLIENIDGEYMDEDYFAYEVPFFANGDKLTVSYRDKEDDTYVYNSSSRYFVNQADPEDRIRGYRGKASSGIRVYADQSEQWTLTEGDNCYRTIVYYECQTTQGQKIHIVPNPVESIAFSRNGDNRIKLIDGKDAYTDWTWDDETQSELEYERFEYWFKPGDRITVNYTGGKSAEYEYRDNTETFVNIADETDILKDKYLSFYDKTQQSYRAPWEVNKTYEATVGYCGQTFDVYVDILPNPVTKVVFKKADNSDTVKLIEKVDGDWDEWWDSEDNEITYFRYEFPEYNVGDTLTVTRDGGLYSYKYKKVLIDGVYRYAFVNITTDDDVIRKGDIEWCGSNQRGRSPWVIDKPAGEEYYFEFEYYGCKYKVPAEIIENPVSEFEFGRDGYDADHPIELTEGLDADINSDGGDNRFFEYYLTLKNGDRIKVTDPKGDTSDYNAVPFEDSDDVKYFENDKGNKIELDKLYQSSNQSYENQWKPGDGNVYTFTLEYLRREAGVNVKIKENPVREISFKRPGNGDAPIDLVEYGDGYWGDRSFRYEIRFKAGDELYVKYSGKDDPVKYVAAAGSDGVVSQFVADGTVPAGAKETISVNEIWFRHNTQSKLDVADDEQATIMLMYQGMWVDVPVNLVESSVESIEFIWKEGGDRLELIEGVDGNGTHYYDEYEGDTEGFEYSIPYAEGDVLKVKYSANGEPVTYTFNMETGTFNAAGSVPEGVPEVIKKDDIAQRTDQRSYNQWTVGNDYEVELIYLGRSFNVPVKVVENNPPADCDHNYGELISKVEPTCKYNGTEAHYECSKCHKLFVKEGGEYIEKTLDELSIPATGKHNAGATVRENEVAATCEKAGHYDEAVYCTVCHEQISRTTREIPATGHDYNAWTKLDDNQHQRVCKHNSAHVEKAAHGWDAGVITKEPSCTEKGVKTFTCSICGAKKTEEVAALGHTYGAWTKLDDNQHQRVCKRDSTHVEKAAHSWDAGQVTTPATATTAGVKTYSCSVCGATKTETIPATGPSEVDNAISEASDQADVAADKADAAENSTNENVVNEAETAAAKAVEMAAAAEESAAQAQAAAQKALDNLPANASDEEKAIAQTNLNNATMNLAVAKQIKAAASSSLAKTKKAAASIALKKAAEASAAAASAPDSATAETYRKEAETYAAKAAADAAAAEAASEDASKAASDLEKLADTVKDPEVKAGINAAKTSANTSASTASKAATAADTSSKTAKGKEAEAKTAVDKKAAAEKEAEQKPDESKPDETKPDETKPSGPSEAEKAAAAAKTSLNSTVTSAKSIDQGIYSDESYKALQDAIHEAEVLMADPKATAEQLKAAADKIKAAEDALAVKADPVEEIGEDGTAVGPGASAEAAEAEITSLPNDNDPEGAKFAPLLLKSTKQTKTSIKLTWKKVSGARKYVIYGNACGKTKKFKKLTTATGSSKTIKKAAGKKLKKGTYYKFLVVALDSNNKVVSTSRVIHVATKGKGNHTKVTTKAKKNKVSLKKGKTFKLGAKATGKSVKKHVAVRYESSNPKVAKVNKSGKITAKKKGTCYVYVFAQNGLFKKIKVTVK